MNQMYYLHVYLRFLQPMTNIFDMNKSIDDKNSAYYSDLKNGETIAFSYNTV